MPLTRQDVDVAEDAARAHLDVVDRPESEGWVCLDCPDENGYADPPEIATWLWREDDGATPLCHFHAEERVHAAIPYGANCARCGKDHSALWPESEPLFEPEWCLHCGSDTCIHATTHNAAYGRHA